MDTRFWLLTAAMAVLAVVVVLAVSVVVPMEPSGIVAYGAGGAVITILAMVVGQREGHHSQQR